MQALATTFASAALSITKPISVFSRAERGSKLKEPTKRRVRSTANVLACRLDDELPINPPPDPRGERPLARRFNSYNLMPAASNGFRRLA